MHLSSGPIRISSVLELKTTAQFINKLFGTTVHIRKEMTRNLQMNGNQVTETGSGWQMSSGPTCVDRCYKKLSTDRTHVTPPPNPVATYAVTL